MVDPNSKIGCFFSRNLTIDDIPAKELEEAQNIVQLHNKFVEAINNGDYPADDFLIFRRAIATEKVFHSELLINLCNFYLEQSKTEVFMTEFNHLVKIDMLRTKDETDTDTKYVVNNIRELYKKVQVFCAKFLDSLVPSYYEVDAYTTELNELSNLLDELSNPASKTYEHFHETFNKYVRTVYTTPEFVNFFIQNEQVIYKRILTLLRRNMMSCSNSAEGFKDRHFKETISHLKNLKVKRQTRNY